MKTITRQLALLILLACCHFGTMGQYDQSGALLTVNSGALPFFIEDWSAGAVGGTEPINRSIYAVSNQYSVGSKCYRTLRVFEGNGDLKAVSKNYSHDHNAVTKVLFHPTSNRIIYTLYRERRNQLDPAGYDSRIYVRRFVYTPGTAGNLGTLAKSPRYEVFDLKNNADFVIAPNGDLLVGAVQDDLSVVVKAVRWGGAAFTVVGNFTTSPANFVSASNPRISMDMKGDDFVIGHDRGNGLFIKKGLYIPGTILSFATTTYAHLLNGYSLHRFNGAGGGYSLVQGIGLRPDGDVYFVNSTGNLTDWELYKMKPDGSTTLLNNGSGGTHLVASQNGECFLAHKTSNVYQIDKYNVLDEHEHTYIVHPDLAPGLSNLAVYDCTLLSSGRMDTEKQVHEKYSCAECAPGGLATADATMAGEIDHFETLWSSYGWQNVPVYCSSQKVKVDGSKSSCESRYSITITEWNLPPWQPLGPAISTGWVPGIVPQDFDVAALIGNIGGGVNGRNFHVEVEVDGPGGPHADYELFRLEICKTKPKKQVFREAVATANVQGGLEASTDALAVTVFPNPTSGTLHFEVNNASTPTTYQIVDAMGRVVVAGSFVGTQTLQLPAQLATGIYTVKFENESGKVARRLMVQE